MHGPSGNPSGVGAVVRIGRDGRFGPARELHAGSGWWSQDASVVVLARSAGANQLQVQWPGGKRTHVELPEPAREVVIAEEGLRRVQSE